MGSERKELENTLKECHELYIKGMGKKVVIFGAGNTAELYRNSLLRENISPIFYIDNNPNKDGTLFYDVPVIRFNEFLTKFKDYSELIILICSGNRKTNEEISKILKKNEINHLLIDQFILGKHKQEVIRVYNLLYDDKSKKIYAEIIISRINNTRIKEEYVDDNQYFALPEYAMKSINEVFVDVGAYVGDSAEQYIWKKSGLFKKIYAFEPDSRNYSALLERRTRLMREWAFGEEKFEIIKAGVGKEDTRMIISSSEEAGASLSAKLGNGSLSSTNIGVQVFTLDKYFENKDVSIIKADIESYEYDMLLGSINIIKEKTPKLSLSIYHNASDLFDIPLLINNINTNYKLSVRHHSFEYDETVIYAYLDE